MASGTGYIFQWVVDEVGGLIHICSGDRLVGNDVAFSFDECSEDLKAVLSNGNISDEVNCPPPRGTLRVRFDFDIQGGLDLAVNVRRK